MLMLLLTTSAADDTTVADAAATADSTVGDATDPTSALSLINLSQRTTLMGPLSSSPLVLGN